MATVSTGYILRDTGQAKGINFLFIELDFSKLIERRYITISDSQPPHSHIDGLFIFNTK